MAAQLSKDVPRLPATSEGTSETLGVRSFLLCRKVCQKTFPILLVILLLILVKTNEEKPASLAAQMDYICGHLAGTTEAGPFLNMAGYLDRNGRVSPMISHPDLFARVGWSASAPFPLDLIQNLHLGMDIKGNSLTHLRPGGRGWQQGKEVIIPFPSELSELLSHMPPKIAYGIVGEVFHELVGLIDAEAVRVRIGGGRQEWQEARCLTLGYAHFLNHFYEPEVHLHAYPFAPALDARGLWLTRDNGAFTRNLQGSQLTPDMAAEDCGRRALTDRLVKACRARDIEVDLSYLFARQEGRVSHGATVSVPEMTITAGEAPRERHAQIVASQHIKAIFGVQAPTSNELREILANPGQPLEGIRSKNPQAFATKLRTLGLVDDGDRLLSGDNLRQALASVAHRLEIAEAHLAACTRLPGSFIVAEQVVQEHRSGLLGALDLPVGPPSPSAIATWRQDYLSALAWAGRPGSSPPQDPDRPSWVLLRDLRTAGFIIQNTSGDRHGYHLTDAGRTRLQRASVAGPSLVPAQRSGLGARLEGDSGPRIHRVDGERVGGHQAEPSDLGHQRGRRDEIPARTPSRWPSLGVGTSVPGARPALENRLSPGLHRGLDAGDLREETLRFRSWSGPLVDPGRCSPDHADAGTALLLDTNAPAWDGRPKGLQAGHRTHARPLSHPDPGLPQGSGPYSAGWSASPSSGRTNVLISTSGHGGDRRRSRLHEATTGGRELLDSSGSRSPYRIGAEVLERPQLPISSLPRWLTALLESPVAEPQARRILRGRGGLNAGVVGGVPGWEPTPAQRWDQDQANNPKAAPVASTPSQGPINRPRLP